LCLLALGIRVKSLLHIAHTHADPLRLFISVYLHNLSLKDIITKVPHCAAKHEIFFVFFIP
jgi:hypothetical protein